MPPRFDRDKNDDPNLDFKQFLSALSGGSVSSSPRHPDRSYIPTGHKNRRTPPTARPPAPPGQPGQPPRGPFQPRKTKEANPRLSESPPPPRVSKRAIHTGSDGDSQYLISTREKTPEAPITQETAFLPRVDDVSHPMAYEGGEAKMHRSQPTRPLPKKSYDTGVLRPPVTGAVQHREKEPDRIPAKPRDKRYSLEPPVTDRTGKAPANASDERISLGKISLRPQFTLEQLLETMIRESASDLHVATGSVPSLRINGDLIKMELPDLDQELTDNLLLPILTEEQRTIFEDEGDIDFSFDYLDKARFRINYYRHHWGIGASFRLIPLDVPKLAQLGLPKVMKNLLRLKKGLILMAGPSGSGKSTSIASMLEEINLSRKLRIITIEKPIEYVIPSKMSLISQRELGSTALGYKEALWAVLREDPDIIMISELWDCEDIRQVLKISETGHLVIASIRTVDCTKAVERLVDAFPYDEQDQIKVILSESLAGIVAQRLIPRADGRGRVLGSEVLLATQGLVTTIRESKFYQIPSIIQTGRDLGMQTMDQSLLDLIEKKLITPKSAKLLASDHRFFLRMGIRFDE